MINNNRKIYFSSEKSPFDIISEILEKNGIKETVDDTLDKIENGKTSLIEVLYGLSRNLAEEEITEKDLTISIQKNLGISATVAQKIISDIKEKLLVLVKDLNNEKPVTEADKVEAPLSENDILPQPKKNTALGDFMDIKEKPTKKILEKTKITPKSGPDSYREPIE